MWAQTRVARPVTRGQSRQGVVHRHALASVLASSVVGAGAGTGSCQRAATWDAGEPHSAAARQLIAPWELRGAEDEARLLCCRRASAKEVVRTPCPPSLAMAPRGVSAMPLAPSALTPFRCCPLMRRCSWCASESRSACFPSAQTKFLPSGKHTRAAGWQCIMQGLVATAIMASRWRCCRCCGADFKCSNDEAARAIAGASSECSGHRDGVKCDNDAA